MTKLLMVPVSERNVNSLSAHTSIHQPINPFIHPPVNLPNFNLYQSTLFNYPSFQYSSIFPLFHHPSIIPSTHTAFGKTFVTLGTGYNWEIWGQGHRSPLDWLTHICSMGHHCPTLPGSVPPLEVLGYAKCDSVISLTCNNEIFFPYTQCLTNSGIHCY